MVSSIRIGLVLVASTFGFAVPGTAAPSLEVTVESYQACIEQFVQHPEKGWAHCFEKNVDLVVVDADGGADGGGITVQNGDEALVCLFHGSPGCAEMALPKVTLN